ncbi:hypothetical protein ACSSS7_005908 [Eimeria intestinalis]
MGGNNSSSSSSSGIGPRSSNSSNSSSTSSSTSSSSRQQPQDMWAILSHAKSQAFKGGLAGASAQVFNVMTFMWLRTTMNYQYRHGGSALTVIRQLWNEGGLPRFYRGLIPALLQSPLSRFGDTASNVGILSLLDSTEQTKDLPVGVKTALASCGAAGWRLFLMPIDAWKTTKQVEGGDGLKQLTAKGAATATAATAAAITAAAAIVVVAVVLMPRVAAATKISKSATEETAAMRISSINSNSSSNNSRSNSISISSNSTISSRRGSA